MVSKNFAEAIGGSSTSAVPALVFSGKAIYNKRTIGTEGERRMRSGGDKRAKQSYARAAAILDGLYVALFAVGLLFKNCALRSSALYLTVVSLVFAAASGYVAYLHSKLPKEQREKPNWTSASDFSTHPYVTFALFAALSVIGLCYLLTASP